MYAQGVYTHSIRYDTSRNMASHTIINYFEWPGQVMEPQYCKVTPGNCLIHADLPLSLHATPLVLVSHKRMGCLKYSIDSSVKQGATYKAVLFADCLPQEHDSLLLDNQSIKGMFNSHVFVQNHCVRMNIEYGCCPRQENTNMQVENMHDSRCLLLPQFSY